jgi:colanic acid/amylovoran biosynthesis glycosyltransferase
VPASWELPPPPWVLHSTPLLGNLTDRWIDTQARTTDRFGSRLLGMDVANGAERQPHWLVARDRVDLWLAYKARVKSFGLSTLWLSAQLRVSPPSVIHAHYGAVGVQLLTLARGLRSPLVGAFYGADATKGRFTSSPVWRRRARLLFSRAAGFVAEGPAMAARIEALGCDPAKVHVVPLPADAAGLANVEVRKADTFLVSMAGRFIPKKGFDFGIRAFARAFRDASDARLLLIGGGEMEDDYRRLVDELGIGDRVEWAGRLPFEEFMTAVARSHVSLHPSRTAPDGDSEGGAPVTLIEGQWVGVPAIVSDHDDLPFVAARDGSVVLPTDSVDAWADALRGLWEDRGAVDDMSAAASNHAREHHSPEANARGRERVYARLA